MSTTQPDADLRAVAAARAADPPPRRLLWPRLFPDRPRPAAIRPETDDRLESRPSTASPRSGGCEPEL